MKLSVTLLLVVLASASASPVSQEDTKVAPGFTRVYSSYNYGGIYTEFFDYAPDLSVVGFDNYIRSVCQTGVWFYYEQVDYNQSPGNVYWVHGVEICANFPLDFIDQTSSLRFGDSPYGLNRDCFRLYQGELFTGYEYGNSISSPSLDILDADGSSLVITGVSPWTFYTGTDFTGASVCVYPSTDHDVGVDGTVLDYGLYITMAEIGVPDNSIRSVRKGCFSEKVVRGQPLEALHRSSNGAMGVLKAGN